MIRYGLVCSAGHGFDGWFRSSGDFDDQRSRAQLACPACGSAEVSKALMAPALAKAKAHAAPPAEGPVAETPETSAPVALVDEGEAKIRRLLSEFRAELTKSSENVGDRFPEIARRMHAEEIEHRTIHGRATAEEARALIEEGVPLQPLPTFPDDMN